MDYRRVVLGIGNPGPEHDGTRHNIGFAVVDAVAERMGLAFQRLERKAPDGRRLFSGRVKGRVVQGTAPSGEAFLLAKPLTYVNLSGDLAVPLLRACELGPESLFVVVDDLNLPLGRMRCRPAGSSGGHNGLKSIERALGTDRYPRLRLGIGQVAESEEPVAGTGGADAAEFVLARFDPEEQEVLGVVLDRAVDAVVAWLDGISFDQLMGAHNGFDARRVEDDAPPADDGGRAGREPVQE